jgi:hypothetical protein
MQCFPRRFVSATEERALLIDLTAHFMEMRRYRVWTKARFVRTIDPSGGQFRADEFGRLICYEDYDRQNIFGWISVSIDSEDYPVNLRSLPELKPSILNPVSLKA